MPPELQSLVGTDAPEFPSGLIWLNGGPVALRRSKDKIFLVEFWTYSCVNCLRVLPYLKRWHEKYSRAGLVVIGVHSPEFGFEKDKKNVERALQNLGVTFPVVLDNDYKIWNLYANRFWPRKVLIDSKGKIVYDHAGEGAYDETELKIYELLRRDLRLAESLVPQPEALPSGGGGICYQTTPETYLGYERGRIGEGDIVRNRPADYRAPVETSANQWYLSGRWLVASEYVEHAVATEKYLDYLLLHYQSVSVNCVISPPESGSSELIVSLNGLNLGRDNAGDDIIIREDGKSILRINEPRMYSIVKDTALHEGRLKISVKDAGVRFHAFTFGGCPGQI